jgi:hypothetical protein
MKKHIVIFIILLVIYYLIRYCVQLQVDNFTENQTSPEPPLTTPTPEPPLTTPTPEPPKPEPPKAELTTTTEPTTTSSIKKDVIMSKICVLQTDNRPSLNYLLKSQKVNKKFCEILKYEYLFLELDNNKYGDIHPATKKIYIINDFLENTNYEVLVFLDSDAWIQDGCYLNQIIINLINNKEKQGCFSRDYYTISNTFINSGSFIIKNNDYTKQMFKNIIQDLCSNNDYHHKWPFDQYYISKYIFENKENFVIFVPDILNTPTGKILRHNWWKNQQMHDDLDKLIKLKSEDIDTTCFILIQADYYDKEIYPNINPD